MTSIQTQLKQAGSYKPLGQLHTYARFSITSKHNNITATIVNSTMTRTDEIMPPIPPTGTIEAATLDGPLRMLHIYTDSLLFPAAI